MMTDWARHRNAVRGFVRRLVADDALADDLTQETFERAQRSTGRYRGEASALSWLCAIALNLARDHFRSQARLPETTSDAGVTESIPCPDTCAEDALLQTEMSRCINEFMARLPHPQYDAVVLHDLAGLSHREIAAQLGISPANSRVLLHRGRTNLRAAMEQGCTLSFGSDAIPCERRSPGKA